MGIGSSDAKRIYANPLVAACWPCLRLDRHLQLLRLKENYTLGQQSNEET